MNREYYFLDGDVQKGPLSIEQLKAIGVKSDTYVWAEGMSDWQPAKEVDDFKSIFSQPPPLRGSKPPVRKDNSVPQSAVKPSTPKWVYALLAAGTLVVGTVIYNVSSSSSTGGSSFFSNISSSSMESDAKKMAEVFVNATKDDVVAGFMALSGTLNFANPADATFVDKMRKKYSERKSEFSSNVWKEVKKIQGESSDDTAGDSWGVAIIQSIVFGGNNHY